MQNLRNKMGRLQISDTAGTGPDMLSKLPPEMLLHVMSYLPVKHIAALKRVNRPLNETVSYHESHLCSPRIKEQLSRIENETSYASLAGVPLITAIRRYVTILCRSKPVKRYGLPLEFNGAYISRAFTNSYCKQNPERYPDFTEMDRFVRVVLTMDYWLQYGEFSFTFMRPFHTHLLDALLDAIDETLPVSQRYNRLLGIFSHWTTLVPITQMLQLFEEMRRAPIVRKSDLKAYADVKFDTCRPPLRDGQRVLKRVAICDPEILSRQIDLPRKVSDFYTRLAIRREWVWQAVRRFGSVGGASYHGLMWTAMLEDSVVVWF